MQLVSALENSTEFNRVGFIDDSKESQGNHIKGLKVYSVDGIVDVITKLKVDEVLLATTNFSKSY